ncbi:MAG: ABC transporter ATP-binding protein [Deltaproteobacteria bacterium]|nr:ABC transporter ATP-binding protein [Deltaproteobacteria bacterium]
MADRFPKVPSTPIFAPGLRVQGVCKTFDRERGQVLKDIDLHVQPDTFFALLGPSGCGKSTLLRVIAGLEPLDSGVITLNGVDITRLPANKREVNTVFQCFALFPHLTVFENVAFGLKAKGIYKDGGPRKVAEKIEALELTGLERYYPAQLSGGQQQRVALARALVNEPQVLLLDEPMSHLDGHLKSKVGQDLLKLQRTLKTIFLMVTHDREDAMTISKEMAILHEGKIVQQGNPRTLFSRPNSSFVAKFMGKANIFEAKRAGPSLAELPFCQVPLPEVNWSSAKILVNPDCVEIRPADALERDPARVLVPAEIDQVRYRGYNVELLFKLENVFLPRLEGADGSHSHLQVLSPCHDWEWYPGQRLALSIKVDSLVTLETQPLARERACLPFPSPARAAEPPRANLA